MITDILYHFYLGLINSLRIDSFLYIIITDDKIINILWKIIKFNLVINLFLSYFISLIFPPFCLIINFVSIFFHTIHYFDVINNIPVKTKNNNQIFDTMAVILTITIYQISISLMLTILNYIFYEMKLILGIINYIIPTIYHSFYFYNNVWQRYNINIQKRIDTYETFWPYYFGYGTLISLLYYNYSIPYIAFLYNMYMFVLTIIPFSYPIKKQNIIPIPENNTSYFKIDMSIFSYISKWLFRLISLKFRPI